MVCIQIGVRDPRSQVIDPVKKRCCSCGAEFYVEYCRWAGGIFVTPCCPGCREPITEYTTEKAILFGGYEPFMLEMG